MSQAEIEDLKLIIKDLHDQCAEHERRRLKAEDQNAIEVHAKMEATYRAIKAETKVSVLMEQNKKLKATLQSIVDSANLAIKELK